MNASVKGIIYNCDGKLLMQQRDLSADIPFPGYWTLFGGQVEENESLEEALQRELLEEIGCMPGEIEDQLFQWKWEGDWASTMNHYFPIKCTIETSSLQLNEGNALAWFSLDELINKPLISGIYENFSQLVNFFIKFDLQLTDKIESKILADNDLIKKNNRVFYAKHNPCTFSRQKLFLLKELAILNKVAVFRVCMHTNDDCGIHEMLMIHTMLTSVGPLKQEKTSLSYHMIEGSLIIKMHNDAGGFIKEYLLSKNNGAISIRLDATKFRSVHTNSPFAIFLEVASGPFVDNDTIWLNGRNLN